MHADPAGDFSVCVAVVEEFLDLDPVVKGEVAVMCGRGSAAGAAGQRHRPMRPPARHHFDQAVSGRADAEGGQFASVVGFILESCNICGKSRYFYGLCLESMDFSELKDEILVFSPF